MADGLALLIPGGRGQLGRELALAAPQAALVHAPTSTELDVTQAGAVIEAVSTLAEEAKEAELAPVVLNAAGYTAVDAAESDQARAYAVNADGPRVLAAACSAHGVPLVHISTDYVFAGTGTRPYEVDDLTEPRSVYGVTKLAGEHAVLRSGARAWVVRTAWVYGAHGGNFVKTIARLERERDTLSIVDDQRGSPTWAGDLARALLELAGRVTGDSPPESRILHCAGGGETSWCGFARAIFEELGADPDRIKPATTAEVPRPAPRPAYSVLADASWRAAGLTAMRPWREALSAAFAADSAAFRG